MRLLLINANTTSAITDRCVDVAQQVASSSTQVRGVTATFGATIIASRAQNTVAGHAMLELVQQHAAEADCILIAVSYDTALLAAREISPVPVIGMTEAALGLAAVLGRRIGLVCFATPDLYMELATAYGLGDRIAGIAIATVDPSSAYADPDKTTAAIQIAVRNLVGTHEADAIVLCGAAMAGLGRSLADAGVPVVDGIIAGTALCEAVYSAARR